MFKFECNYIYFFNGTVSGLAAAETWGSRWRHCWGTGGEEATVTGGPDEQQMSWRLTADGSCPVLGADDGFRLIILI